MLKNLPAMQETGIWSLGWEDPLKEEMETHSSILAWRILVTVKPGGLQSMGSHELYSTEQLTLSFSFNRSQFNNGFQLPNRHNLWPTILLVGIGPTDIYTKGSIFKAIHNNVLCVYGLHGTVKKNKEVLYALGWNHLQHILLHEEKQRVYVCV